MRPAPHSVAIVTVVLLRMSSSAETSLGSAEAPEARKTIESIRSAYLGGRSVDSAMDAAGYRAAFEGLAKAREVQLGRPPNVSQEDYAVWLQEAAVAFGLDEEQERTAERLYLGRTRAAFSNGLSRGGASLDAQLGKERQRSLITSAWRAAGSFEGRSPEELVGSVPGNSRTTELTEADYERLNGIPAVQGYASMRTASIPEPKLAPADSGRLPYVASVPTYTPRAEVRLVAGAEAKGYEFRGKRADAFTYTARFKDGADIEIIVPRERASGWKRHLLGSKVWYDGLVEAAQSDTYLGNLARIATGINGPESQNYSVRQVADSTRYLPRVSRKDIRTIVVNPVRNPEDSYWEKTYNMYGFRSYMTAGAEGVVTIYPKDDHLTLPGVPAMRISLLHEAGHVFSHRRWGHPAVKPSHEAWARWRKAAARDGAWVSQYAQKSDSEDFAETFAVFHATFATSRFSEYKSKVPMRFAIVGKAN